MKELFLFLLLMTSAGCVRRPVHAGTDYLVGKECRASARLLGCDQASPPHCRKIVLSYANGCEKLALGK